MKRLLILHIVILVVLTCVAETNWQTDFLAKHDLTSLIRPDSVATEEVYSWWTDSAKQDWVTHGNTPLEDKWFQLPEPLGFRGNNYQRFEIHFDSVYKSSPTEYGIHGKIRCQDTILFISGRIMIDSVVPYHDTLHSVDQFFLITDFGDIHAHYSFFAYRCPPLVARLFGEATYGYLIHNDSVFYDAIELLYDGYCNNQYTGKWVYLDSGDTLICNWGDFRIPQSGGIDIGAGRFGPAKEYISNGWSSYVNGTDSIWWEETIDCKSYSDAWTYPEFPGGNDALFKWLSENVHFPAVAWLPDGRVVVQFIVKKDGSIAEIAVVRSSGYEILDETALQVISSMPNWIPGTSNGEPADMRHIVPIRFTDTAKDHY